MMPRTDWSKLIEFVQQATLVILTDEQAKAIAGSTQVDNITFGKLGPALTAVGYTIYRDATKRIVIHA
jgi:hypothetical protein